MGTFGVLIFEDFVLFFCLGHRDRMIELEVDLKIQPKKAIQ
jgi:hypothetical protein